MAIKQKQEEQKSKLIEVLQTEYRWENLLLGVLAVIAIGVSLLIISGTLGDNGSIEFLSGTNLIILAWVLLGISIFGLILVIYPFFLPAFPEIKKISWPKWPKFLDNAARVFLFLAIITGFLLLFNVLITRLLSGLLGGTL